MSNTDVLNLPVSLGEAIDKLTILDIKLETITDFRKKDVLVEFTLLKDKLNEFIIKYNNLYETMKKVNLLIWNMMDKLRDGNLNAEDYLTVCKECIEYNDIRFRVKNKINYISKSFLKEQKSYKINRIIISINININNNETLLNIIKYLSFIYDEIIIESIFPLDFLKEHLLFDNTIIFTNELVSTLENISYVKKVNIENNLESNDLYNLFNVQKVEINKII